MHSAGSPWPGSALHVRTRDGTGAGLDPAPCQILQRVALRQTAPDGKTISVLDPPADLAA